MKKFLLLFLTLSLILSTAACAKKTTAGESSDAEASQQTDISDTESSEDSADSELTEPSEDSEPAAEPDKPAEPAELSSDRLVNSLLVADQVASQNPDSNMMFSPTSLNYALGMLTEGASEETREVLQQYLASENFGAEASAYLDSLENKNFSEQDYGPAASLEIANSIWIGEGVDLNNHYQEYIEETYRATAEALPVGKPVEACEKINAWVEKSTHDMIHDLATPDTVTPDTKMVLINTVYFESPWNDYWFRNDSKEDFTKLDGTKEQTHYLYHSGDAYFENDKATAFSSSYYNGLEFIGILPKATGDFTLTDLDIPGLLKTRTYDFTELSCHMPGLNFETEMDIAQALENLGLEGITQGMYTEMANIPMEVSAIIQKTKLELDDKGTRAAAATEICMEEGCAMPEKEIRHEVYLTRPYAFLIYDPAEDEVLFVGKVLTTEK